MRTSKFFFKKSKFPTDFRVLRRPPYLVSILEYFYKEGWTCNKQAVEALQKQGGVPSERILRPFFANKEGVIC